MVNPVTSTLVWLEFVIQQTSAVQPTPRSATQMSSPKPARATAVVAQMTISFMLNNSPENANVLLLARVLEQSLAKLLILKRSKTKLIHSLLDGFLIQTINESEIVKKT